MNQSGALNVSTPGGGQKRALLEGPNHLKMLVSNLVAGSIIGKNGAVIGQIESNTGVTMKLSPASSVFPGTSERIVVMGGEQAQINAAIAVILEKINEVTVSQFAPDVGEIRLPRHDLTASIVVPKSAVSGIIGKGGQQIKRLQEESKAKIQISNREVGLPERVVSVSGSLESVHAASIQICQIIQEDPNLKEYMYVKYPTHQSAVCAAALYNSVAPIGFAGYGPYITPGQAFPYGGSSFAPLAGGGSPVTPAIGEDSILNEPCEIAMEIPDALVGVVIGRSGVNLAEIMRYTNATIKVAQKGDFVPGTQNRKVVIAGPASAVHRAHLRLLSRIREGSNSAAPAQRTVAYTSPTQGGHAQSPSLSSQKVVPYAYNQMGYQQPYAQY